MDALYLFRHSRFNDVEIRYSLRGVARYMPWVRKVWIFGDRRAFLSDDTSIVEHVPQRYVARIGDFQTPVTNFFHMLFLSSLIPELDVEFLWFCDDFILIDDLPESMARKNRCLGDLGETKNRGTGLWKESLWRTCDLLQRLKYPVYNFETHTPSYFRRRWVFEAYGEFQDFVTQDRWFGMLGITAILNHAYRHQRFDLVHLESEGIRAEFWGKPSPGYETVPDVCRGKTFLNFDDAAFGPGLHRYLAQQFPTPSRYERPDDDAAPTVSIAYAGTRSI